MKKLIILILILLSAASLVWYNSKKGNTVVFSQAPAELERERMEEIVACIAEIPIGEAMLEALNLNNELLLTLNDIQLQGSQYRQITKQITSLAGQCTANNCNPSCTLDTISFPCPTEPSPTGPEETSPGGGTIEQFGPDIYIEEYIDSRGSYGADKIAFSHLCTETVCTANACFGTPCPREKIDAQYQVLDGIYETLTERQEEINLLLEEKLPKAKEKLDEARQLFTEHSQTIDLTLRNPVVCQTALKKFLISPKELQERKMCENEYNFLVCR